MSCVQFTFSDFDGMKAICADAFRWARVIRFVDDGGFERFGLADLFTFLVRMDVRNVSIEGESPVGFVARLLLRRADLRIDIPFNALVKYLIAETTLYLAVLQRREDQSEVVTDEMVATRAREQADRLRIFQETVAHEQVDEMPVYAGCL
jgi:hypothetical protein